MNDPLISRKDSASLDAHQGNRRHIREAMTKSACRAAGARPGRRIVRGASGSVFGGGR